MGCIPVFEASCSGPSGPPSRALWLGVHSSQWSGCRPGFANNTLRCGLARTGALSRTRSAVVFAGVIKRDDWLIESWSEAGTVQECLRDFAGWHEDVLTIVGAADIPYKWALLSRQPLPRWTVGRVSLLGDACHPTLPFMAQGGNMAIEDGMVLARCLKASTDIAAALRRYEAARLDRTSQIVLRSSEALPRIINPQLADPDQATALMDREYLPGRVAARYDWLYEYNAMTVPI